MSSDITWANTTWKSFSFMRQQKVSSCASMIKLPKDFSLYHYSLKHTHSDCLLVHVYEFRTMKDAMVVGRERMAWQLPVFGRKQLQMSKVISQGKCFLCCGCHMLAAAVGVTCWPLLPIYPSVFQLQWSRWSGNAHPIYGYLYTKSQIQCFSSDIF